MSRTATTDRPGTSANAKRQQKRDELWPDAAKEILDFSDKRTVGYTQIPRVLPLITSLINMLDKKNAGTLYTVLWGHNYGQGFIDVSDPDTLVYEAGYTQGGPRSLRTWKERMDVLTRLGFVWSKQKGAREHGYVLLRDPHKVVLELIKRDPSNIPPDWMNLFKNRCIDIGISLAAYEKAMESDAGPATSITMSSIETLLGLGG